MALRENAVRQDKVFIGSATQDLRLQPEEKLSPNA